MASLAAGLVIAADSKTAFLALFCDVPYLVVAQVSGIVRIGPTALAVGLPLWLVVHTDAPRALAA